MTRTDVMASSRPRTAGAAKASRGISGARRRLSFIPAVLLLVMALALPSAALAASESTSGYNQTPNTPTTGTSPPNTPTTGTSSPNTPTTGTSPSKETSTTPTTSTTSKGTEPSTSTSTSTPTTTGAEKSGTLPFTGFDLRWSIGFGVLLMGAGFAIVMMQRRQSRDGR
ncbi:MAG TPA: hypothetical protein VII01_09795 [Solirubrobacteraceae bacterium]